MKRKLIFAIAIFATSLVANSCEIAYTTSSDTIKNIIEQNNGIFLRYPEKLCHRLKLEKALISIDGNVKKTDQGTIIAQATATVKDADKKIFSPAGIGHGSMKIERPVSLRTDEVLYSTINEAVESINIEEAIFHLNKKRETANKSYKETKASQAL